MGVRPDTTVGCFVEFAGRALREGLPSCTPLLEGLVSAGSERLDRCVQSSGRLVITDIKSDELASVKRPGKCAAGAQSHSDYRALNRKKKLWASRDLHKLTERWPTDRATAHQSFFCRNPAPVSLCRPNNVLVNQGNEIAIVENGLIRTPAG
jgi:hypothetical protein